VASSDTIDRYVERRAGLIASTNPRKKTMAIFQKSPEKTLQRDRDTALANRDRLATSLTAAEDSVIATKRAAQSAALSGDDAGLDAAEHAEAAALRRLATIEAAHSEADRVLALLEGQIAARLDETTRAATAAETNALADELIQAAASFDIAIRQLGDISNRAALISFEATGLANFSASSRVEVPAAAEIIASLLREHAKQVLNGMAPAMLPRPDAPVVPVKIVPPVTKHVFTMKPIKWTVGGNLRFAGKYAQVDLPPAVADRALAIHACVTTDSDAFRRFNGTHVAASNNPEDGVSLDEGGESAAPASSNEPIQFERVNRGPSYQLRVAGSTS
jgi:hypothetical protein